MALFDNVKLEELLLFLHNFKMALATQCKATVSSYAITWRSGTSVWYFVCSGLEYHHNTFKPICFGFQYVTFFFQYIFFKKRTTICGMRKPRELKVIRYNSLPWAKEGDNIGESELNEILLNIMKIYGVSKLMCRAFTMKQSLKRDINIF